MSVCLTGARDIDRLADEGIHLISVCHLNGSHYVIGVLRKGYNDTSIEVEESVYKGIAEGGVTDRSMCAALRSAVVNLRDA